MLSEILTSIQQKQTTGSFLIHYKDKLIPLSVDEFAYFYIKEELVHGVTHDDKTYPLEQSLEELELRLNHSDFFRANRQYIVAKKAIKEIDFFFNGRLLLNLIPKSKELVLISKAKAPTFKQWMKGS